jgi:CMP-N,N'-diacetyllegionaminic acid synthase
MNASIYAYSPRALREKEHSTFFNNNCDAIVMFDSGILDIDSEEDYELMQVIAKYLFENNEAFKESFIKANNWK